MTRREACQRFLFSTQVAVLLVGCSLFHDPALDDNVVVTESPLGADEVATRIEEGDATYQEPRSIWRVRRALELYLDSVSPSNNYGGLWRASRACYWLGEHHSDDDERKRYARKGVQLGRAAGERAPLEAAGHYYHALNLGLLSQLEGRGLGRVEVMEALAKRVIELDPSFEYAGGPRYLGILYDHTKDNPLVAMGDFDDALAQLERACHIAPDYGGNQLALARLLVQDEEYQSARKRLELVLSAEAPPDEKALHAKWAEEARRILQQISDDEP